MANNLYPPIFLQSYMPAFVRQQGCYIYFAISDFNSESDIQNNAVQVSIKSQKTNKSVLSNSNDIMFATMNRSNNRVGRDRYYIFIKNTDIKGGFKYNEYYKVQLRFTSNGISPPTSANNINTWINANQTSFSQWSTVILIRPISVKTIQLQSFKNSEELTTLYSDNVIISGKVSNPGQVQDSENLKSYYIYIYDETDNLLENSGELFPENKNKIYYQCKYGFQDNIDYKLKVKIITENLYQYEKTFPFIVNSMPYGQFSGTITATAQDKAGRIRIQLQSSNGQQVTTQTNYIIKRTSNKSNFTIWEEVLQTFAQANTILNITWFDYTIESGVWYQYSVQQVSGANNNWYSSKVVTQNKVMINPQDIFLTSGGKQLKIRFDPQISNFSHVISQNLSQTIGSKYPFITRNGSVNYRTFSLSGTITAFMDIRENLMQASKRDIYGQSYNDYENYNLSNNIDLFKDTIYEKYFREEVIDFLYDNNVKLFKSTTEGNILVKLMNITFTPNNTLHRHIYSFSCTAYQVDKYTYQNCLKYNIQQKGSFTIKTGEKRNILGQLFMPSQNLYWKENGSTSSFVSEEQSYFPKNTNLVEIIKNKYKKLQTEIMVFKDNPVLSYVKIQLSSPPYLIKIGTNGPERIEQGTTENTSLTYLGHILNIDTSKDPIIIGKDGIYELTDENIDISSLSFPYDKEQGSVLYIVNLEEQERFPKIAISYQGYYRIGQLWKSFNAYDSIYGQIFTKYSTEYRDFMTVLNEIKGVRVYADEGIVFYIKERQDNDLERHVINSTGMLQFFDDNTNIQGLYFVGPHLLETTNSIPRDYEYLDTGLIYNRFEEIKDPIKNGVYTIIDEATATTREGHSLTPQEIEELGITNTQYNTFVTETERLNQVDRFYNQNLTAILNTHITNQGLTKVTDRAQVIRGKSDDQFSEEWIQNFQREIALPNYVSQDKLITIITVANNVGLITLDNVDLQGIYEKTYLQLIRIILGDSIQNKITINKIIAKIKEETNKRSEQGIRLSSEFLSQLNKDEDFKNQSFRKKNLLLDKIYQNILKQYISSSSKYIFYQGNWYPFDSQHGDVSFDNITAIVDYYCYIIREEYAS